MFRYFATLITFLSFALPFAACTGEESPDGGDSDADADWSEWDDSCNETTIGDLTTGTTWQWQLTGSIDDSFDVDMYDVDLFNITEAEITSLQAQGRTVICYFSAGTWEEWRDDADDFDDAAIGETMEEWDDEKWLDVRHDSTREMVEARLDIAAAKGCDGVEPDNMDGYANDTGFDLTGLDQLDFNKFVAQAAHARGLSVGLKNDVDQLEALEGCFDWALNEECLAYDECDKYAPFVEAGKAVFHVEYVDDIDDGADLAGDVCGDATIEGFSTLIKEWDLESWFLDCR